MQCPICLNEFDHLDEHHIYPKAYGGPEDGPLLNLCAADHQGLHSQARADMAKNPKKKFYFLPDALERARPYVNYIIRAKQNYDQNIIPEGGGVKNHIITFKVDLAKLTLLHSAKLARGFASLDAFFEALADQAILSVHGASSETGIPKNKYVLTPSPRKAIKGPDS